MTIRDAVVGVMRRFGMTRIFGNPGSTEVPFLVDPPRDFECSGCTEGTVRSRETGGSRRVVFVREAHRIGVVQRPNKVILPNTVLADTASDAVGSFRSPFTLTLPKTV